MENILKFYKDELVKQVDAKRVEINNARSADEIVEKIREDLSTIGRSLLSKMFVELKGYVENNKPDFIEKNADKWNEILEKAKALTEYGLYVAPIDILKDAEGIKPAYVGVGAFALAALTSKLTTKKFRPLLSLVVSLAGSVAYSTFFGKDERDEKEFLLKYVDDAYEWIKTALENMYKVFQDAV
ncbi:hypothetical protein [Hippea jasoniae]|uniref:hypothetical protein n=1 Tax=Hippea jasoniae TaxID=944479 RepID=UPI000553D7D1|nr:hypothetical protein [Hippea jasoniae]